MDRDALHRRLKRSIRPIRGPHKDPDERSVLGTAFICGQKGAKSYLLTCWHVIDQIDPDHLLVDGHKAEIVEQGDQALDLALLAVDSLPESEILQLSNSGRSNLHICTIGHFWQDENRRDVHSSRLLEGELSGMEDRGSERYPDVSGWNFTISVSDEEFDRIREGYSGAPVFDPGSGRVVAVISHRVGEKRGLAVDISNLARIYSGADRFFVAPVEDEYPRGDHWIVKTLDHEQQLKPLRDRLEGSGNPVVALVEGCSEDLPKYLADDVLLDPWPTLDDIPREAISLNPARYGGEDQSAFWNAVHHCVPGLKERIEDGGKHQAVIDWLREYDRHLFFISIDMRQGWRLPLLIRAASSFLAELSDLEPRIRPLMLIVCQPSHDKPPWRWFLYRFRLKRIPGVLWLKPLRLLERPDVETWYNSFSGDVMRSLNRDHLREKLLDLYQDSGSGIRYRSVRKRLIDERVLDEARIGR